MLNNNIHIIFDEQNEILSSSIREMDYQINKTSTVQAHKCKTKIKTYQQFSKKANNRQDQNSWKVSGEYFFAPYIYEFIKFIKQKIIPILKNNNNTNGDLEQIKREFVKLGGIIFAVKLLRCKVKFERAKEKPLIRDRTLVLSGPLHEAFRKLHPMLNVPRFYLLEKAKRKKMKKKIVSADFHGNIGEFCEYLLQIQTKTVMNPNGLNENIMAEIAEKYNFPKDWLSDDNEDEELNDCNMASMDDADEENKSESLYQPVEPDGTQSDDVDNDNEMELDNYDGNIPPPVPISWKDDGMDEDNNTQYSDNGTINSDSTATSNSNNQSFVPFNVIQTRGDNNYNITNNNTMYNNHNSNNFGASNYGGDNNVNNGNVHALRVEVNSRRAFQEMPNFTVNGINKANLSPDSTKYERKYKGDRELYIQQANNWRNNNSNIHRNHQRQRPSMRPYNSYDPYKGNQQRQRQRVQARLPPTTRSAPFEPMNYGGNTQSCPSVISSVASTAPSTPSTPTLPPRPPAPARYNPNNYDNGMYISSIDNQNDNNTGNESVISEPISIFPIQDLAKLGPNGMKLEFQISSPGILCPMGSDTVMMGSINTDEMGFSYNKYNN